MAPMHALFISYALRDSNPVQHAELCERLAPAVSAVPGLVSKTWLANAEAGRFGGFYVFESKAAFERYVAGELFDMLTSLPFASASAVESPPNGIPPSTFAMDYKGCLGELRSRIARGEFAGVGPFAQHFNGQVNPGAQQGTVGEEESLRNVLGIADPTAFCAQFTK